MDTVVSTIIFIIALGLLICLHELGHFFFAKLFGVYCHEFSIGFGPALIHKRKEGKETYFSLRAIPLGGYVAMYGEEGQDFEDLKLPKERSLEGIKKWKKGIIISAGIVVNTIISIILIGVSNFCFPISVSSNIVNVTDSSITMVESGERLNYILEEDNYYFSYQFTNSSGVINAGMFAIIDDDVQFNSKNYVLTYTPTGTKKDNVLSDGLMLYPGVKKSEIQNDEILGQLFVNWAAKDNAPEYFPNVVLGNYKFDKEVNFDVDLVFIKEDKTTHSEQVTLTAKNGSINSIGLSLKVLQQWLPLEERWSNTWSDFGSASAAVFQGLATLFSKNGIKNMSGIVGIFTYSGQLYSNYTFATYLYFWGMISINLAIFNLLPFPGLDGWQLLVTIVEGVSRKKLPSKFKEVMSIIGFVLLAILMIAILAMDIIKLV